jgi:hypothetical protein
MDIEKGLLLLAIESQLVGPSLDKTINKYKACIKYL